MKKWQVALLGILVVSIIYWIFGLRENGLAYEIQTKIEKEINTGIQNGKAISLTKIGGVQWDHVCFASYEAEGIDVTNGLHVAQQGLESEKLDFSDFSVANEDYNEFSRDWMYGLVFVSIPQKLLVAISIDDVSSASMSQTKWCSKASNASLLRAEEQANGHILIFEGKM